MTTANVPADYEQRQLALNADLSFICEAPAGSGKTELLTQRVLVLLARVSKPEEVLAITFTRKAAAEMRDRILRSLHLATLPLPNSEHEQTTWRLASDVLVRDNELGWRLRQNPSRLQILTFDSLCARLTKSLPLHSSLGASLGVAENADDLYREAAQELFLSLEQDVPWSDALAVLLRHVDNSFRTLESLFINLLRNRDQWLPIFKRDADIINIRSQLESYLQQVLDDGVQRLRELIPLPLQKKLCELAEFAAGNLSRENVESPICTWGNAHEFGYELPESDVLGIQKWLGLKELLLTQKGEWRSALTKKMGFPPGVGKDEKARFSSRKADAQQLIEELKDCPELLEALQDLLTFPSCQFDDGQWITLEALAQTLPILVAHLHLVFRANNQVDFSEISQRARAALGTEGEPTDLALRLDHRIQHILVDEFQDTSKNQLGLLEQLTEGWQEGDGRTLFCVGDAMQSIYGFRGANVGLFLYCKQFGLGGVPLAVIRLTSNFRSQKGVVDWFNGVFQKAFPKNDDISRGAVSFAPSDPFLKTLDGAAVEVLAYEDGNSQSEAAAIVHSIQTTLEQDQKATVAILVRNKSHVASIVPALQAAGLPYRAVELESLAKLPCIQDLMSLTLALIHPANRVAWLSVLRAPWCGLTLKDLFALVSFEKREPGSSTVITCIRRALDANQAEGVKDAASLQDDLFVSDELYLSSDGVERLNRVLAVLDNVVKERNRKPLRQWVEGCWIQLGGPASLRGLDDLNNAERYFKLLGSLEKKDKIITPDRLNEAVTNLFATPDSNASDQIQIMTMHKSKGLEFDLVILPQLHRAGGQKDQPLFMWYERLSYAGEEELIISPKAPKGAAKDAIYTYLQSEQKKVEEYEACRLFYVACTRAKKRLLLSMQVKKNEKDGGLRSPSRGALCYFAWASLKNQVVLIDNAGGEEKLTAEQTAAQKRHLLGSSSDAITRLPSAWILPRFPEVHNLDSYIPHFEYANTALVPEVNYTPTNTARYVGTMVHQILHDISVVGITEWRQVEVKDRLPFWRARLINLGVPLSAVDSVCQEVNIIASALVGDENIQWMFEDGVERESEFAISCPSIDGVDNMIVDLLLIDRDGSVWLIDFKTSSPTEGQLMDEFLVAELEAYKQVMCTYLRAVKALWGKPVKAALYFPVIRRWAPYSNLES